jgi:murein DD-endopeptidase MepM/ murein hydrolase activator NlpD
VPAIAVTQAHNDDRGVGRFGPKGSRRFVWFRRRKLLRATSGALGLDAADAAIPQSFRARGGTFFKDIYEQDLGSERQGGRYRWMLSTCLAATVGAVAILVVVYGSSDKSSIDDGLLPALQSIRDGSLPQPLALTPKNVEGLKWSSPKSDRLLLTTGALSTRYIIHESSKSRREGREYVRQKPYARIVARLASVPGDVEIPPFNPFKLYANSQPVTSNDPDESAGSGLSRTDVSVKVVELLGGILPGEDGQELDAREVQDIVERNSSAPAGDQPNADSGMPLDGVDGAPMESPAEFRTTLDSAQSGMTTDTMAPQPAQLPNTTDIVKIPEEAEEPRDDLENGEVRVVKVGRTDTLSKILRNAGADAWEVRDMIASAHNIFPEAALVPGQEVRITLVPSLTEADTKEPARFSIFSDGHDHIVTVTRNAAGEFVASAQPLIGRELQQASGDGDGGSSSTLYSSVYHAGLMQRLPPETIQQILRVNAFDTDFRRRVRPGDSVELFFDMKDEQSTDGPPGEMLYSAVSSGGQIYRYYRFRSGDGVVDYYDTEGNNSKKFLMRKPVRGDDVRLTSGYGVRFHPLLNVRKMHTGVDWATSPGTPILASGNGVIEEAGHKGYNGIYVRIRHANGYHTAYSHMSRIAEGVQAGIKVRQGQVIGYVGSTGLSSGPHLHFEVLVNNRFVDPMSIQVPRERKLGGKDLIEFQKERARIDELMRRAPVMTASK